MNPVIARSAHRSASENPLEMDYQPLLEPDFAMQFTLARKVVSTRGKGQGDGRDAATLVNSV